MTMHDIYHGLKDCFVKIRHLSFANTFDYALFAEIIEQIKIYEQYIIKNQLQSEHHILLYCIKTLFTFIDENDRNKICDFADTIHNIPEIYLGKRTFDSFSFEIKEFRDKYGKEFFAEICNGSNP